MPRIRYPTRKWPIAIRRPRNPEIARLSFISARFIRRASGARGPMKRHSGGFRAPLTKVIRMQCWFSLGFMPLGGELRKTTSTPTSGPTLFQSAPGSKSSATEARQLMGVLETRMTPEELNQAKAEAGRWHAVPTQAKPAVPADDVKRDSQPPPAPAPAVSKQSPAAPVTSSADPVSPQGPRSSSSVKKDDMDALLERVPSELRKRFGF